MATKPPARDKTHQQRASEETRNPGKYDPADFIVIAHDAQGQSERIFCRVPPGLSREMDVVVSSKYWPFRTKGDVMRWCVKVGVERLAKMEPINSVNKQVDAVNQILQDELFNRDYLATFDALQRTVQTHLNAGAKGEAARLVSSILTKFRAMPDGYWRDRYVDKLTSEYGYLLEGTKGKGSSLRRVAAGAGGGGESEDDDE